MTEDQQPTIDDRLKAISLNLELLSANVHAMQEQNAKLDRRERRARRAIAEGIVAYFKALNEEPPSEENEGGGV